MKRCGCCSQQFDRKEMVKSKSNGDLYCKFCFDRWKVDEEDE